MLLLSPFGAIVGAESGQTLSEDVVPIGTIKDEELDDSKELEVDEDLIVDEAQRENEDNEKGSQVDESENREEQIEKVDGEGNLTEEYRKNRIAAASIENMDSNDFAGGNGEVDDPYLIETPQQLDNIRHNLFAHYKLIKDIDLNVAPYNENEGWEPIKLGIGFNGSLDGNGHTISNLMINRPDENNVGLFGVVRHADITDIKIENFNVKGNDHVGSLIGLQQGGSASEIVANGEVVGKQFVGGLIGDSNYQSWFRTISYNEMSIIVKGTNYVGGLIGRSRNNTISNNYVRGEIEGEERIGG